MAAEIRGLVDLSMDIYDRPELVHDLMRICTDWLKGFYPRLRATGAQTDAHNHTLAGGRAPAGMRSSSRNETWVGVGVARDHFVELMKPYERECVQAAHDAGYLVS